MIIAIQEGLEEIGDYIRKDNRYKVVRLGSYQGSIDALIYVDIIPKTEFQENQFRLENISLNYHGCVPQGVLMLNARNKTPQEIKKILEEVKN